ncbi:MAG: BglII/BstYI family type II restriction endonuclease [Acidimicrobiales bacterium]
MPTTVDVPSDVADRFEVREWRNAIAVLRGAYPHEWNDLIAVLRTYRLCRSHLVTPGGRLTEIARGIDEHFRQLGWQETKFDTSVSVRQHATNDPEDEPFAYDSPTHKVDSFKNHVGVEVEWNSKDTFFDRDLNNFRLLFGLRVLGVGVIITRGEGMRALAISLGRDPGTYGSTTTHWALSFDG